MIDLGSGSSPLINSSKTDPRQYETVHCSNCGSIRFVNEIVLKRVSGLEIGAGDKQNASSIANTYLCKMWNYS